MHSFTSNKIFPGVFTKFGPVDFQYFQEAFTSPVDIQEFESCRQPVIILKAGCQSSEIHIPQCLAHRANCWVLPDTERPLGIANRKSATKAAVDNYKVDGQNMLITSHSVLCSSDYDICV